jgi:uncharacterized membrane protein YjgN (DUF898 family)
MADNGQRAFGFSGTWQSYAPIAFTNLALTIVTLGIYRFWATTRSRQYLWSHTRFIDEPLEWTGTGKELLIGFLLVLALFGLPMLFINFGAQALALQGYGGIAILLTMLAVLAIFYLTGVARFRALRYRLSRTHWHGIRGGSDDKGWGYGLSYIWKSFVGNLAVGLLIPWAMMSLWNERWSKQSYGPYQFQATGSESKAFKRFLLFYLLPIVMLIAGAVAAIGGQNVALGEGVAVAIIIIYALLGVVALAFYAIFFREAIGGLSLSTLDFRFTARTKDWFKLILGDVALVVLTLGVGMIFLSYRHWKFFIDHLDATGEVHLDALVQSTTAAPGQGEGLADAFDMGAF